MDGSGLSEKGLGCSPALLKEFAQCRYDTCTEHGFPMVQNRGLPKGSCISFPRATKQANQSK